VPSTKLPDKRALLEELRAKISAEIERGTRSAKDAAEAATHEENKAEGDKDMRSTEASYIARGQAERVRELDAALGKLAAMPLRAFADGDRVAASAIVEIDDGKKTATYFLVTAAGGLSLGDGALATLATTSPLGAALLGLEAGDEAEVTTAQGTKTYELVSVR
jgi:transcription elongation GreA/GreB family factor